MPDLWTVLVSSVTALAGTVVGQWLGRINERRKHRQDFAQQQLRDFYAPAMDCIGRIKTLSGIHRLYLGPVDDSPDEEGFRAAQWYIHWHSYNTEFYNTIFPAYEMLLAHLSAKLWLIEPSTRAHHRNLLTFMETLKNGRKPQKRPDLLNPTVQEEDLQPLFEDIEHHFDRLQGIVRKGASIKQPKQKAAK